MKTEIEGRPARRRGKRWNPPEVEQILVHLWALEDLGKALRARRAGRDFPKGQGHRVAWFDYHVRHLLYLLQSFASLLDGDIWTFPEQIARRIRDARTPAERAFYEWVGRRNAGEPNLGPCPNPHAEWEEEPSTAAADEPMIVMP